LNSTFSSGSIHFLKSKRDFIIPAFAIVFVHFISSISGFHSFSLATYPQIVQNQFPAGTPFWEMLFYFHGNPPLLSLIHKIAESLFGSKSYLFFDLVLPWLHVCSFFFFKSAISNFGLKVRSIWSLILFLNPLIFIYFKYPFYSTFLFFTNAWLLYLFSKLKFEPKLIFGIASLFSIACLLRASYLPMVIFPFLVWLSSEKNIRTIFILFLILLPPLSWQFKNYVIVGKFSSSSWIGMNVARCHKPWYVHNQLVDFIPPFSSPASYFKLLGKEPQIKKVKAEKNYYLSQNNLNNSVIPIVSDLYYQSMLKDFSPIWSFNSFLNGLIYFGKSPANFNHLLDVKEGKWMNKLPPFCKDFFDWTGKRHEPFVALFVVNGAWDLASSRAELLSQITIYTLFYPFLLFFFSFYFFKMSKTEKAIFILTAFFFFVYCTVDVFEANRMRFEIEVFFYFLAILFFKKMGKRNSNRRSNSAFQNIEKGSSSVPI